MVVWTVVWRDVKMAAKKVYEKVVEMASLTVALMVELKDGQKEYHAVSWKVVQWVYVLAGLMVLLTVEKTGVKLVAVLESSLGVSLERSMVG